MFLVLYLFAIKVIKLNYYQYIQKTCIIILINFLRFLNHLLFGNSKKLYINEHVFDPKYLIIII
jgi:hypothetical protein